MRKDDYLFDGKDGEIERLDLLNAIYNPYSQNFIEAVLPKHPITLLEVGCGQGGMSQWLAQQKNIVSVLGIDIDETALKAASAKSHSKMNFQLHSVYDLNQLPEQYDVIYERFTLIHLTNPVAALRAIYDQLKPGGLFICETSIHSHCFSDPKTESYDLFIKYALQTFASQGKDADLGKHISSFAMDMGLAKKAIQLQQPLLHTTQQKKLMYLSFEHSRKRFEQENLASADELNSLGKSMAKEFQNADSIWAAPTLCQFAFIKQ